MTDFIVKVQMPLDSNVADAPMLIYNKDKSVYLTVPVQKRFAKELAKYPKGYYRARVEGGVLDIGRRVAPQEW